MATTQELFERMVQEADDVFVVPQKKGSSVKAKKLTSFIDIVKGWLYEDRTLVAYRVSKETGNIYVLIINGEKKLSLFRFLEVADGKFNVNAVETGMDAQRAFQRVMREIA